MESAFAHSLRSVFNCRSGFWRVGTLAIVALATLSACSPPASELDSPGSEIPTVAAAVVDQPSVVTDAANQSIATPDPQQPGALPQSAAAQVQENPARTEDAIHFVIDVSGSMSGARLSEAKNALKTVVGSIPTTTATGLRSYSGECDQQANVSPLVPIGVGNNELIAQAADGLVAWGGTPTTAALEQGLAELQAFNTSGAKRLVLLTDGDTQCNISVCDFMKDWQQANIALTLYTVGLDVSPAAAADLTCAAESTGGQYVNAATPNDLLEALTQASGGNARWITLPGRPVLDGDDVYRQDGIDIEVADAPVFIRQVGMNVGPAPQEGRLITLTLNLAGGLADNIKPWRDCKTAVFYCEADKIASNVADDVRNISEKNPNVGIVLMFQEARPILIDKIAARIASSLNRRTTSLFASGRHQVSELNERMDKRRADGSESGCPDTRRTNSRFGYEQNSYDYECVYGNAIVSTIPVRPLYALQVQHKYEKKAMLFIESQIGDRKLVLGTMHALIEGSGDHKKANVAGRTVERRVLDDLSHTIGTPIIIGGDFNSEDFKINDDFVATKSTRTIPPIRLGIITIPGLTITEKTSWSCIGRVLRVCNEGSNTYDYFLSRPKLSHFDLGVATRKWMDSRRLLPEGQHLFDHARIASGWNVQ